MKLPCLRLAPRMAAAGFACALLPAALSAQSRPAASSTTAAQDEPIVLAQFEVSADGDDGYKAANAISGTRFNTALLDLPRPIEVITAEFIEDIGAKEIGEALKYSGSLSDNGTATPEDVTGNNFYNRGFQSFTSYRNGYRSFGVADTLFIDRVEIIKGPSSTFSGTIDPGGTMNMITRRPGPNRGGHVRLRVGSYDRFRSELLYSTPIDRGKKLRALFGAAYENYGSQYDFAGRERKVYGGNLQYEPTKRTRLGFDFQWQTTRGVQAVPPIYFIAAQSRYATDVRREFNRAGPESSSAIIQTQFALDLSQQLTPNWVFRGGGYFRSQRQARNTMAGSQALVINATTGVRTVARVPTLQLTGNDNFIVQGSLLGDHTWGDIKHKAFLGFEYLGVVDQRNQQYRRPTNPANLNVDSTNPADYALGAWSTYTTRFGDTMLDSVQRGYTVSNLVQLFRSRLLLMQGYRYGQFYQNNENRLNRTAVATSQSADVGSYGASFRVAPRLTFFVSYAESFQPQTASDFFGRLFEPITGQGWDFGPKFDLIEGRLSGSLVAFEIERSNILQPDPDHPGFNIASGVDRSRGIEFTLTARPLAPWQVVLSYANVDVETIKDPTRPQNVGLTPPNVARNQGNLWNRYAIQGGPLRGLGLGVGVAYVGERRGNPNLADIPAYRSPAYTRVDANLTYARKLFGRNLSFSLALQNVTDRDYYPSYTSLSEPFSGMFSVLMRF
ncbi:MAG: TonB-dependent siderophore receptor [Verrucomicrobia bacterium]|nr:TonB-dependent siderophore receptor [Verrucomicrobiota bacterium]